MEIFQDQVNIEGKSLGSLIEDSHKWVAVWNWSASSRPVAPVFNPEATSAGGGVPTSTQLDRKIEQRVLEPYRLAKMAFKGKGKGFLAKPKQSKISKGKGKGMRNVVKKAPPVIQDKWQKQRGSGGKGSKYDSGKGDKSKDRWNRRGWS